METKFLDYDARPSPRKPEKNEFVCCKCGRLRKNPEFYLIFTKEEHCSGDQEASGQFPFMIHPKHLKELNASRMEFLPIGSECTKKIGKEWVVKKSDILCECGHFKSDHNHQEGCLGCPCKKGLIETKTKEGYVAMNDGEFDDFRDMTFLNDLKEAEQWKGQKILKVEVKFILGKVD